MLKEVRAESNLSWENGQDDGRRAKVSYTRPCGSPAPPAPPAPPERSRSHRLGAGPHRSLGPQPFLWTSVLTGLQGISVMRSPWPHGGEMCFSQKLRSLAGHSGPGRPVDAGQRGWPHGQPFVVFWTKEREIAAFGNPSPRPGNR